MAWARIDDRFYAHPKHLAVGLAGNGLFARGLAYCAGYATDGFLPEPWVRGQLATAEERKLPGRLIDAGLWERVEDGYRVHDYLDYNMSREDWKAKQEAAKRGADARWHGKRNPGGSANALPEPEPESESEP